ncbi:MAG: transcription-repair coupling factor [Anaerolineae bacterium]|nr:transcription-repair coupling factor [Anaerolineae bacterium]
MDLSGILKIFDELPAYDEFIKALDGETLGAESGAATLTPLLLPSGARAPILAKLFRSRQVPILLLTGRVDTASRWMQMLEAWLPEDPNVYRFYEPTPLPYERGPWGDTSRLSRLRVLARLMAGQHPQMPVADSPPLIVSSARAFLQKTLPKRRFLAATRVLKLGGRVDLEKTRSHWLDIGYESVSVVEDPGQFSQRGGIVDIFPPQVPFPIRIELFGDEIDTVRLFDPATQRSMEMPPEMKERGIVIPPAREALPMAAARYGSVFPEDARPDEDSLPSWRDDIEALVNGRSFPTIEFYLPLIYAQPTTLLSYLPDNALVIVDDWRELETAVAELRDHADQIAEEQPSLPPDYPNPLYSWPEIESDLAWWRPLILGEGAEETAVPFASLADAFETGPRYGGQMRPLLTQLKHTRVANERTIVVSLQAARLAELWREDHRKRADSVILPNAEKDAHPVEQLPNLPGEGSLTFVHGAVSEGFTLIDRENNKILLGLLTDAEIFGWNRPAPRRWRQPRATAPETYFSDIQAGDYVVHLEYGIGKFQGLVSRTIGGMEREYLLVKYANSDVLYVPVHQADRLSKWIGSDERPPGINRLGEKSWTKAKTQAQRAAHELAGELLDLYAARETVSGHAFSPDDEWQAELEASFPYRETEDQLRVISEVKDDMERPKPMDRLICGDVGYGKTEVALRAAFKAVVDGKQVAILVPTTILAQQHYHTFRDRLKPFPVKVEMLSRFRTQSQQEKIVHDLRNGDVDIIIGTHRLVSDDVSFKDLGLVIIDEEQRFGVAHKEKLKSWRTEVDVLTMTATPIPRTLYMSLTGVRDISVIDTAPAERLPVQTYVGEVDETRLKSAILRELDRGGQIFFVHNRVQTIDIMYRRLQSLVPEAIIAIGHGQMSERELEKIMNDFSDGLIDILLSTTIIESGIDFPNANTLIVDRAEQFGLSQLYQLRGRVGRATRRAYAYFFHAPWRTLTGDAQARLETLAEQTQLGAGYQIAMRDMEIRGAGDLLSGQQSGHISAVGFDLYTRLLTNAVKRLKAAEKGEALAVDLPEAVLIDLPLAAYVPPDYVPDGALRLRLYRRMALLDTLPDIDEMAAELADRFGPIPDPTHNLLYQLRIKALAQEARITAVTTEAGQIRIRIPEVDNMTRYRLQRYVGSDVRVSKTAVWLPREMSTHEWQVALVQVLERLETWDWNGIEWQSGKGAE